MLFFCITICLGLGSIWFYSGMKYAEDKQKKVKEPTPALNNFQSEFESSMEELKRMRV